MIFPTLSFLIFFLCVWPAAWVPVALGRHGLHKGVVIGASYIFYSFWSIRLALVLLACALATWGAGRFMSGAASPAARRGFLTAGIAANLGALGFFKYYDWFAENLNGFLVSAGLGPHLPLLDIVLPIGISFFTLQGISYLVDLYRGVLARPSPLIDVVFFISFFPHLLAGPIVRAAGFLPQLERPPDPHRVLIRFGVVLIVWGIFKKVVVANWLGVDLVDRAYFDPAVFGTVDIAGAIYGYAVQIYCDFSGYTDIAIGLAALLGYQLPRNFNQPYRAATLRDFWRRWHMSLSRWMRDYVYIPLGGSRGASLRTYVNLLLTMLIGGLWHGAAWQFPLWGTYHAGALAIERLSRRPAAASETRPAGPLRRIGGVVLTFHVVCLGWILFRAEDLAQATDVVTALANWSEPPRLLTPFTISLIIFGIFIQFTPADLPRLIDKVCHHMPAWLFGALAGAALVLIGRIGGDSSAPFIYFQF